MDGYESGIILNHKSSIIRPMLPYVSINMAMSLDGKATTSARQPGMFTSRRDKELLVALRARADAVMAGAGTVRSDSMTLGIPQIALQRSRTRRGLPAQPVRVIVSGTLRSLDPSLRVFKKSGSPIVIFCSRRAASACRRRLSRVATVLVCGRHQVDLRRALRVLATQYHVRHLHVEGGPVLNGALFDAGLVDELDLTLAGVVFGGRDAPTILAGQGVALMRGALGMRLASISRAGSEWYLRYVRRNTRSGRGRKNTGFRLPTAEFSPRS